MIHVEDKYIIAFGRAVRQFPELAEFIRLWKESEMESLPDKLDNTAFHQGRCRVLRELDKFLSEAPETSAKIEYRNSSAKPAHR